MRPELSIRDVPAAVLAGGLAKRLQPIKHKVPNALVEGPGKPCTYHPLALLHRKGIRKVVLCVGHLGEQIQHHVGDGSRWGLDVCFSFDGDKLLGTGGALRRALPLLGELYWVLYGDSYMDIDYRAVLDAFQKRPEAMGLMTVLRNYNQWDRSNVIFRDGQLLRYDKRTVSPEMHHIDYGTSLLRRTAIERLPADTACDIADLLHALANEGALAGYEVRERFYEIGSPTGLQETAAYLCSLLASRAA